jgi:peroxiredoxin
MIKDFDGEQVKVIAGSVDSKEKAEEFVNKLGITFPVACNMDAEAVSKGMGAFYHGEKKYIQPTGFIVRPDKTIEVAVYSSGPVGRFVAQDVLNLVRYYKSRGTK